MSNEKSLTDIVDTLIGDTPISVQLAAALEKHTHDNYVLKTEFDALKDQVEKILDLIGDTSVAEQINAAINK